MRVWRCCEVVNTPRDMNAVLRMLLSEQELTMLAPEDEQYLRDSIALIRKGNRGIIIAQDDRGTLRYMFSNASRAQATAMLGKVIEATGKKMAEGQ